MPAHKSWDFITQMDEGFATLIINFIKIPNVQIYIIFHCKLPDVVIQIITFYILSFLSIQRNIVLFCSLIFGIIYV